MHQRKGSPGEKRIDLTEKSLSDSDESGDVARKLWGKGEKGERIRIESKSPYKKVVKKKEK